eukprot:6213520-Pleurochrysis_carterae.AAC.2
MTARTVAVSDSEPFQSAAIRWVSEDLKKLEETCIVRNNVQNRGNKHGMRNLTNVSETSSVAELRRYSSTLQFPTMFPAGSPDIYIPRYRGYSGKQANLT